MTSAISLIVPTYNSSRYLDRFFRSLLRVHCRVQLQVVVVDDSAADEATDTERLCREAGATYHFYRGTIGAKRNYGVTHSCHDIILFVDSDCELTQDALEQHATLARESAEVGAMIGLTEFVGELSFSWEVVQRSQFLGAFSFARRMKWAPWGTSCNLSVKREAFNSVGGFDPSLFRSEDVDLGLRLNDAGFKMRCNPAALVLHTRDTWHGLLCMMRRVFNYGRGHFRILSKFPEKTTLEFPKMSTVAGILTLPLTVTALVLPRAELMVTPLIFCFVTVLMQAACTLRLRGDHCSGYPAEVLGQSLDFIFELGVAYESARHLRCMPWFRKMVYARQQLISERERRSLQAWCMMASLAGCLLAAAVWSRSLAP